MDIQELQPLLTRFGLKANTFYGQHFLMDEEVLNAMVEVSSVGATDAVLEIGPGIGNLTARLAVHTRQLVVVEKDKQFEHLLNRIIKQYKNIHLVWGDILEQDLYTLVPTGYKAVANIPYYLTAPLIRKLLYDAPAATSLTLLIQKEVAENITAEPGNMNLMALSVQLKAVPSIVLQVPKESFYPAPKVESAVIHIAFPGQPPHGDFDERAVFRIAKACFGGKRKQIHNTLKSLGFTQQEIESRLTLCNIPKTARPQDLSVGEFIRLSEVFVS